MRKAMKYQLVIEILTASPLQTLAYKNCHRREPAKPEVHAYIN
jgi:hypothetical protein